MKKKDHKNTLDASRLLGFNRLSVQPGGRSDEAEIVQEAGRMLNKAGLESINRQESALEAEAGRILNKVGDENQISVPG